MQEDLLICVKMYKKSWSWNPATTKCELWWLFIWCKDSVNKWCSLVFSKQWWCSVAGKVW